jgi:hypothetical protein
VSSAPGDRVTQNFQLRDDERLQGSGGSDGPRLNRGVLTATHQRELFGRNLGYSSATNQGLLHGISFVLFKEKVASARNNACHDDRKISVWTSTHEYRFSCMRLVGRLAGARRPFVAGWI